MEGYMGFMDVLGFSGRVLRDASLDFFPQFTSVLERTVAGIKEAEIDCIVSSDSIVIYSMDSEEDSLLAVVKACSQLSFYLLSIDLPMRGCISCGNYTRWETKFGAILAGRPIIDAYHYEEEQDWIGVMIAPSVAEQYPPIDDRQELVACDNAAAARQIRRNCPWPLLIQRCSAIPFHHVSELQGYLYDGYAVLPTRHTDVAPEDVIETIGISVRHLKRLKALAPEPQSQEKYATTIRWLKEVRGDWEQIIASPYWKKKGKA